MKTETYFNRWNVNTEKVARDVEESVMGLLLKVVSLGVRGNYKILQQII